MLGGLALLGLGAMVAAPADAPTSIAEIHKQPSALTRPGGNAERNVPSRHGAPPRVTTASTARRTAPMSLRALGRQGPQADGGASRLGVLEKLIPPPTPAVVPSPTAATSPSPTGSAGAPAVAAVPPIAIDGSAGTRILAEARKYLGVPYVFDGATPAGFDCSGYTMWVYAHAGVANLPHNSEAQRQVFRQIPQSAAQPGDLIFYMAGGTSYHVAIFAGGNLQYAAPATGQDVKIEPIWSSAIVFGTDWHA